MATKEKNLELVVKKELPDIQAKVPKTIENADDMKAATELLSRINQHIDAIEDEKEKITKPLNEALKNERARWKPLENILLPKRDLLRSMIGAFQTAETKRAKEEADRIAARVAPGKGHLTAEKASDKIAEIEKPQAVVASDAGIIKFRTDKKLKIMDPILIPRAYLVPDEKKILEDLKAGKVVAGCIIEEIQTPINLR